MDQTLHLGLHVVHPADHTTNVLDWVYALGSNDLSSNMMVLDAHLQFLSESKADADIAADEKYFDIDYDGIVALKPEYRGQPGDVFEYQPLGAYPYAISDNGIGFSGSRNSELPENMVVPDVINGTAVAGFRPGMFYGNRRIKRIVLPSTITELPEAFCDNAWNLVDVVNTEQVQVLGTAAFRATQLTKATFPNLTAWGDQVFQSCVLLQWVDIGDYVEDIGYRTFSACRNLSLIRGGASVKTIKEQAFYYATNLRNLPLLSHVTSIEANAFVACRVWFDWSSIEKTCCFGAYAVPIMDNCVHKHTTTNTDDPNDPENYHPGCLETFDYWDDVKFTPCEQPLCTLMSQKNPEWVNSPVSETGKIYRQGCATFALLHIHSALSQRNYEHPDEFVAELEDLGWPTDFVNGFIGYCDFQAGHPHNSIAAAKLLGYAVTGYSGVPITREIYQELVDKMRFGAYALIGMGTPDKPDSGHALVVYGINEIGEFLIADSDNAYNRVGLYNDGFVCRMPFQNFTGPKSVVVIIEKLDGLTARVGHHSNILYVDGTDDVLNAQIIDDVLYIAGDVSVRIDNDVRVFE